MDYKGNKKQGYQKYQAELDLIQISGHKKGPKNEPLTLDIVFFIKWPNGLIE